MDLLVFLELDLGESLELSGGCIFGGFGMVLPLVNVDSGSRRTGVKNNAVLRYIEYTISQQYSDRKTNTDMIYPLGQTTNREGVRNCDERNGSFQGEGIRCAMQGYLSL